MGGVLAPGRSVMARGGDQTSMLMSVRMAGLSPACSAAVLRARRAQSVAGSRTWHWERGC